MKQSGTRVLLTILFFTLLVTMLNCPGPATTRPTSGNSAYLTDLSISGIVLDQSFNRDWYTYKGTCPYAVDSASVLVTMDDSNASYQVKKNGVTATGPLNLDVGDTTIDVVVTSEDTFTVKTYTVVITRADGSGKSLDTFSFLQADNETSIDSDYFGIFSDTTIDFVLPYDVDPSGLIASFTTTGATVKAGSVVQESGVTVNDFSSPVTYSVYAENGTFSEYSVVVTVSPSDAKEITSFSFESDKNGDNNILEDVEAVISGTDIDVTVGYSVDVTDLVATFTSTGKTVRTVGVLQESGVTENDFSSPVEYTVTAHDDSTIIYTVTVTREAASTDANASIISLSAGTLTPAFSSGTTSYNASVSNSTDSLTVTAATGHPFATYTLKKESSTVSNPIALDVGDNSISIEVTAEDGITTKIYTVVVRRVSVNADLASLSLSAGDLTPSFDSSITGYTAEVGYAVSSIDITYAAESAGATVVQKKNGLIDANPVYLGVGDNTITVEVTAEDSATTKTYSIVVRRVSNNAGLSSLSLSGITLTPSFSSFTSFYTATVPNATASTSITAVASHGSATVVQKKNGVIDANPVALDEGENEITVVVTAEDGVTTRTYTIDINRSVNGFSITYGGPDPEYVLLDQTVESSYTVTVDIGSDTRDVYMIFTNTSTESGSELPEISSSVSGFQSNNVPGVSRQVSSGLSGGSSGVPAHITEFNETAISLFEEGLSQGVPKPNFDIVGQSEVFKLDESTTMAATCRKTLTTGGMTLNIYVADNCWVGASAGKAHEITQAMVDNAADKFLKSGSSNDIYEWVTGIFGAEWGPHGYGNLISDDDTITILMFDIDEDNSTTGGVLGYYWAKDNFTSSTVSYSNERLMFYLDSVLFATPSGSTWESTDYWPDKLISTLAHEFQHMIHWYQKSVVRGVSSETWLNEMCSMMAEDFLADKIQSSGPRNVTYNDPSAGSALNQNGRLPLYNYFNESSLTSWYSGSDVLKSYSVNYAFGAYLGRNFGGVEFFNDLINNDDGDYKAVEHALLYNGSGDTFDTILRKWAVANLFSDWTGAPSGVRYNKGSSWSTTSINSIDYNLGSINLYNYAYNSTTGPYIYTSLPLVTLEKTSNLYLRAGDDVTGANQWTISNPGDDIRITVVIK
jgi:tRNA threonylcarbamoyladenosine modification (KEOPS) complex  Pcc1 subunit